MVWRNAAWRHGMKEHPTGRGSTAQACSPATCCSVGECGTAYRQCVWTQPESSAPCGGVSSRLDYGKKFCLVSHPRRTAQQAILAAVNAVMLDRDTLARQLAAAMEWELAPVLGERMSLADIDRALEELSGQFNSLLAEASANPAEDYTGRFRELSESTAHLREQRARLEGVYQENQSRTSACQLVSATPWNT